jgi:hypothetical protein
VLSACVLRSWSKRRQTPAGRWISFKASLPADERVLNVVDDVTRECLAAIPDTSISGRRAARERIASREMFPDCWPLPHLICSQHLWVLSKSDEANQRNDEEGIGCCSGKAVCCRKAGVKLAHPRSVRSDQRVASQTCDALAA